MSRHRDEFIAQLAKELPRKFSAYTVAQLAGKLCRISARMNRHATNLCNIPDYQPQFEHAAARAEVELLKLLDGTGIKRFQLNGDPRGAGLKIEFPSHARNGFDDLYGVPDR